MRPATQHRYSYAVNNPGSYTDPTGRMPVWALRFVSLLYNAGQLDAGTTSLLTLVLNGGGVFTALHEIAQLNAAKRLHDRGLESILEYSCGGLEVDIVSGIYAWEVKPLGTNAQTQLLRYMQLGNLVRGDMFGSVEDIPVLGDFRMKVEFDEPGGIHYSFTRNAQGIEVPVFIPEIEREYQRKADRLKTATAVAVAIVAVSVVADFFSGGASVADDPASVVAALKAAQLILAVP